MISIVVVLCKFLCAYYYMYLYFILFSTVVQCGVRVRIKSGVWLLSGYAHMRVIFRCNCHSHASRLRYAIGTATAFGAISMGLSATRQITAKINFLQTL